MGEKDGRPSRFGAHRSKATARLRRAVSIIVPALLTAWLVLGQVSGAQQRDPRPTPNYDPSNFPGAQQRIEAEAKRRASAEAKRERVASRTAHAGLGREKARELLWRTFPDTVERPIFDVSPDGLGGRIERRLDEQNAVITQPDGTRKLVQSTLPMTVPDGPDEGASVDMSLRPADGSIQPVQPLAPTRIGARAEDGTRFPAKGLTVRLSGAEGPATVVDDRVFYSTSAPDTDYLIMPVPDGIETFVQLRSADSPEQLDFALELPAGAHVRPMKSANPIPNDPPESFEIVKGDERLAIIYPPNSLDADGVRVPTSARMVGDTLRLKVDHRGSDLKYPLLVDPWFGVGAWYEAYRPQRWTDLGWRFLTSIPNPTANHQIGVAINDPAYAAGAYLSLPTNNTYQGNEWGELALQAPPGAYIGEAQFGNIAHFPYGSVAYHGFQDPNKVWQSGVNYTWGQGLVENPSWSGGSYSGTIDHFCFYDPRCAKASPSDHNWMVFGIWVQGQGLSTGGNKAMRTMGWANTYLGDRYAPTFVNPPGNGTWFNDGNAVQSLNVDVNDYGLGTRSVELFGAASGNGTIGAPCDHGTPAKPWCVNRDSRTGTFGYRLGEGTSTMTLRARDLVDNVRDHSFVRQVDRTAPTHSLPGPVKPDATLKPGTHSLVVNANDVGLGGAQNSGVKVFRAWVDGTLQTLTSTCTSGACSKTFPITLTSDGPHTIAVEVEDGVSLRSTKQTFSVSVDGAGPEFLRTNGPLRQRWLGSQSYDLRIDVKDFAGSSLAINEIRGGSFEGDMPAGHYVYKTTATTVSGEVPAVHGSHVAKLVATSNDGLAEIGNDNDFVAVRPGETVGLTASARSTVAGRRLEVAARFMTASGGWIGKTVLQPLELTAGQWGTARGAVITPPTASYVAWETRVAGLALNEVAYVDAVQLERGAPSGAYAPHADETPGTNSAGTNTVRDSSFEAGGPAGTFGYQGTIQTTTMPGTAAHGNVALRLTQTATPPLPAYVMNDTNRLAVQAGQPIAVSAYARATTGAPRMRARVRFFNASGAFLSGAGSQAVTLSTAVWRRQSATVTPPAGAVTAGWEVAIDGMAANESALVDAVQVERGDYTTPFGLKREEVPADQRSGVTSLELLDGTATHGNPQTWTCAEGSCMRSHTLAYNAAGASEGRHQISVRAKDAAGNPSTSRSWEVVVDKSDPKVLGVSGPLRTQSFVGAGSTPVRIDASDSGSTAVPRNLLPAASFERGLPYGFSSWLAYANVVTGPFAAADGTGFVRAVQFGGGPHILNDFNRMNVTPGEKVAFSAYVRASVPTGRSFRVEPRWFDVNGVPSWTTHAATPATDSAWTRVQNVFTAPANARQMTWQVKMEGGANGEAFYVDGVQVERAAAVSAFQRSPGEGPDAEQRSGIGRLELSAVPAGGGSAVTWNANNVCTEDSCPRSDWLWLDDRAPEGRQRLTATAEDQVGRRASAPTWETVVDRSAPTVATSATMNRSSAGVQTYNLTIDAADGSTATPAQERSGVTSIEVQVRNEANQAAGFVTQPPDTTQTCPQGSCGLSRTFSMVRTGGRHTVRVIATDQVGNKRIRDRIATFDDQPPDIALSGTLKDNENQTLVAGAYDLRIKATDEDRRTMIRDTFDDGTLAPWWSWSYGTNWEDGGTGRSQCTSSYSGLYSSTAIDLADSAAAAEVVRSAPTGNGTTQTYLQLHGDGGYRLSIGREGSNLQMNERTPTALHRNAIPFDAVQHRWWRIKDEEGDIVWQTSSDGTIWTTHWRRTTSFPRSGLDVELGCGYWGSETNPAFAEFDNVSAGEPVRGSGVRSIEVLLRRDDVPGIFEREDYKEQACPDGTCPVEMERTWIFRPEQYPQGTYTVRVVAKDALGNTGQKDLKVNVGAQAANMRHSVGLEDFWNYETVETGAGTAAHVDLASGNVVWHSVPLVNPGRGLSTVMNVTYNSQVDPADAAKQGTVLEYDEAGRGFSVGVSGVTRLNEPLDVSKAGLGALGGDVVLTDADGTRHVFKAASDGPLDLDLTADYWIPPPGVQLHLRRWSPASLPGEQGLADRRKAWAATRPDGVTFFFDANGYQTSIEDRNGNVLRFDYVYASATSTACSIANSTIGVPDIGDVDQKICIYKLQQVVDSAGVRDNAPGRAVTFAYDPRAGAPADQPPSGRLKQVTDHAGRKMTLAYSGQYLTTLTQAAGTGVARSFRFEYEPQGQDPQTPNARTWLKYVTDPRQAQHPIPRRTELTYAAAPAGVEATFGRRVVNVKTRFPANRVFSYSRDTSPARAEWPNATRVTNGRGDPTMHYSDVAGRPRESVDPVDTVQRLDFDEDNNVKTLLAASGSPDEARTEMTYNHLGQLLAQVDPERRRTELTYREGNGTLESPRGTDAPHEFVGDLIATTTPRGFGAGANRDDFTWRYTVDDQGNVRERYRPGVATPARNEYGSYGLVTAEITEVGDRTEYPQADYDPNGLPRTQIGPFRPNAPEPTDGRWTYAYDVVGNLLTAVDPRGNAAGAPAGSYRTTFTYDALDRVESRTRTVASGSAPIRTVTERWARDLNDNLTRYTDGRGSFWDTTYTETDRPLLSSSPSVAHSDGTTGVESTRMTYDPDDNVTKVEAPEGVRTNTQLDDDYSTLYQYDQISRPLVERRRERTAAGATPTDLVTSYAYDRRDNVVGIVDPRHNVSGDPVLNAGSAAKRRFTYAYDRSDLRTSATEDPGGLALRTDYGYDLNQNLISETDPRGTATTTISGDYTKRWGFNAYDEVTTEIDAASFRTLYTRRDDGLVRVITAPKGVETTDTSADYRTELEYYPNGMLKSRSLPRDRAQYPSDNSAAIRRIFWRRNPVGDPTCITDARGGLTAPDADCSNRYSFRNTFVDTGELASTERPSWWTVGESGLEERDPLEMGDRGGKPRLPSSGNGEGDFGGVDRLELPDLLPMAGLTSFGYDNALALTTIAQRQPVVDGADRVTTLTRDAVDRVTAIDRPFDGTNRIVESSKYDYNGNLRVATDARRFDTNLTYDQFDRRTTVDAPGDGVTTTIETSRFTFDENDNVIERRTPNNTLWKSGYDALDRKISGTDPLTRQTTYGYDAAGNRTLVKTHLQREYKYEYDARNLVTREIDPLQAYTDYRYDAHGNRTEVDAPPSAAGAGPRLITTTRYEGRDLPWTETTGSGTNKRVRAWEFDPAGNLRREVAPTGINSSTDLPRETDDAPYTTDPGDATDKARDSVRLATKYATLREYDRDNLLTAVHAAWGDADRDADNTTGDDQRRYRQNFIRNNRGWVASMDHSYEWTKATPQTARTSYTYFDTGWIATATEPVHTRAGTTDRVGGDKASYTYYETGDQRRWVTGKDGVDRREVQRTIGNNGTLLERLAIKSGDPSPRKYTYRSDRNHNLVSFKDEATSGDQAGRTTFITNDELDRPVKVNEAWSAGKDTTFHYDEDRRLTERRTDGRVGATINDYTGGTKTRFTYDTANREIRTIVTRGGESDRTVLTSWFPSGQRASRVRCNVVAEAPAACPAGSVRATDTYEYADDGRLTKKTRTPRTGNADTDTYTYDTNGNRTKDERGTHTFNARDQLTSWVKGTKRTRYKVDGDGATLELREFKIIPNAADQEGKSVVYSYTGDQLDKATVRSSPTAAATTAYYCHSPFGNVERITAFTSGCASTPGAVDTIYAYDEFDRLISSREANKPTTTYQYDGLDRRDSKSRDGTKTDFSYVGISETLSRESRASTGMTRSYDYDASGNRIGFSSKSSSSATPSYRGYRVDANGSVTGLEGEDGSVASGEKYAYDPYGELQLPDGEQASTTGNSSCADEEKGAGLTDVACDQPFRFEGFYYDSGVKTYDMQARAYRPDIGRFLSTDRYESSAGDFDLQADALTQNRWAFAGGNPVNTIEFDGHYGGNEGPAQRAMKGSKTPRGKRKMTRREISFPTHTTDEPTSIYPTARSSSGEAPLTDAGSTGTGYAPPPIALPPPRPDRMLHSPGQPATSTPSANPRDPKVQIQCQGTMTTALGNEACASWKRLDPHVMNMSVQEAFAGGLVAKGTSWVAARACERYCRPALKVLRGERSSLAKPAGAGSGRRAARAGNEPSGRPDPARPKVRARQNEDGTWSIESTGPGGAPTSVQEKIPRVGQPTKGSQAAEALTRLGGIIDDILGG
jgi:RHS repeat-associated protein